MKVDSYEKRGEIFGCQSKSVVRSLCKTNHVTADVELW